MKLIFVKLFAKTRKPSNGTFAVKRASADFHSSSHYNRMLLQQSENFSKNVCGEQNRGRPVVCTGDR